MPKIQDGRVAVGLLFVVAGTVAVHVGGPWLWGFFIFSVAGGLVIAAIIHRRRWITISKIDSGDMGALLFVAACTAAVIIGGFWFWHLFLYLPVAGGLVVAAIMRLARR